MTWHEKSPMRRTRLHLAAGVVLASAWLQAASVADTNHPNPPPALPDGDRIRLAEAYRLAAEIGDSLWPGWGRVPFATVLVAGENEYFVRHPHPPAGAASLGRDDLLGSDVFVRPRTFSPGFLATFPVEGISTVVVGTAEATASKSPTDWVVTLLHEHFHQLQEAQPGFYEKTAALGLARGDTTGMWMLNFPFAYDAAPVQAAYAAAAAALRKALEPGSGANSAVSAYRERRAALRAAISADDRRYMDFQLWKEGVARYTQLRVARWAAEHYRPAAAFRALPGYKHASFDAVARDLEAAISKELAGQKLAEAKRVVFYPYGAAEALLLDRTHPSWRERYFDDLFTLDPAFENKSPSK